MKRCPVCGARPATDDRFCESDGATLLDDGASAAGPRCGACGQGVIEADGYCSACGKRADSSRRMPAITPIGSALAGGVVAASLGADEYLVLMPGGATVRVVLGEAGTLDREADALERIGGSGAFPRLVESGGDETSGAFMALTMAAADARPLRDVGHGLRVEAVAVLLSALLDAAQVVERLGLAWEPHCDDVHVGTDGSLHLSRLRVPRKLGHKERLDARAVIEAVGPTFVPDPGIAGPPRVLRLLLPHIAIPGDAGNSIEDVRGEIAAVESEVAPRPDDGSHTAGICSPGLRRPHNEDALASASGVTAAGEPWTVLVVCDGVSSSSHAEQASAVAAKTACDALAHFARSGDVVHEAGAAAVSTAIRAAHVAVCAQGIDAAVGDPPGTTIVAGLVWRRRLTVGWVGDSRAYWVSEQGSELVTHDHSWVNEAIARGEVTEAEAALSPLAHALTRCLGPLEVEEPDPAGGIRHRIQEVQPDVRARDLPGPGWIVLCSDGFWNYFSPAAEVATLVRALGPAASPALIARRLVNLALVRGGQDNTTVLVHHHR